MILTDRELVEAILSDPFRREAALQLVSMMAKEQSEGHPNGRYEITVNGGRISSALYSFRFMRNMPGRIEQNEAKQRTP